MVAQPATSFFLDVCYVLSEMQKHDRSGKWGVKTVILKILLALVDVVQLIECHPMH